MDVMTYDGKYFVVDGNRRLLLLKKLESAGLVNSVSVYMRPFDLLYFHRKHTTNCGGVSIRIRNDVLMERKINNIIQQHKTENANHEQEERRNASAPISVSRQRYTTDFDFGSARYLTRTERNAPTIEEQFGSIKHRWIIKGIPLSPRDTVFKIARKYNTNYLTMYAIADGLKATFTYTAILETTELSMGFRTHTNNPSFCDIHLEEREGTYENMFDMVKELHSCLQT